MANYHIIRAHQRHRRQQKHSKLQAQMPATHEVWPAMTYGTSGSSVSQIALLKGQSMSATEESGEAIVVVLSGALAAQDMTRLEAGDCALLPQAQAVNEFACVEDAMVLLIVNRLCAGNTVHAVTYTVDTGHKEDTYSSEAQERTLESIARALSTSIKGGDPLVEADLEDFVALVQRELVDAWDELYDWIFEIFLLFFRELPLAPLRMRATFCARLCAQWTLADPNKAPKYGEENCRVSEAQALRMVEAIRFVAKVYEALFLPRCRHPFVQEAVFWTLLATGERKSVSYLAQRLFVNRTYFSERFKALSGISASEYVQRVKLHGAMLLVLKPQLGQNDLLEILGYSDMSHFSRKFKQHTGYGLQAFQAKFGPLMD